MNRRWFLKNVTERDASWLIIKEEERYARMNFQEKRITAEALACTAERYLADGGLEKTLRQLEPRGAYTQALRECNASDEVISRVLRRAERFFREHLGTDDAASVTGNEELLKAEKRFLLCHGRIVEGYRAMAASFRNGDQPERIFKLKTEIRFLLARLTALEVDVVMGYLQANVF